MTRTLRFSMMSLLASLLFAGSAFAQSATVGTLTTPNPAVITVVPISATAAAGSTSTLTIPAPAGSLYNYICSLAFQVGNNNTGTALNNVVTTNTNFAATFAVKFSLPATNSADSGVQTIFNLTPALGCVKSLAAGTATTFVSPTTPSNAAWTWYATYFQAP